MGELAILAPALGTSQHLLNADHRCTYFEGMPALPASMHQAGWALRRHGDAFERLPGGAQRGGVSPTLSSSVATTAKARNIK